MNITQRISAAPMSGYQWLIIALCTVMNCLDGFDVMAVAFTGPSLVEEFDLTGSQFGLLNHEASRAQSRTSTNWTSKWDIPIGG